MIVLDASAAVEFLAHGPMAETIEDALEAANESLAVPHLLDIEAISALRGLVLGGKADVRDAAQFLKALAELRAERVPHTSLTERMWELRSNFTPYDAVYIALAEANNATLWTCDAKMVKGHRAKVRLFRPH